MLTGHIARAAGALALLALASSCGAPDSPSPAATVAAPAHGGLDVAQARLMLDLLRAVADGGATQAQIDAVMSARGTALVVGQQNLSRQVTPSQYRALLAELGGAESEPPRLPPGDGGERARRGADGLRNDVWPALRWGAAHVDLLARRIGALEQLDVGAAAHELAASMLPGGRPVPTRLHVVMGGRAGAAAIGDGDVYVDVLALSYRETRGASADYPSAREITELFAHEVHHFGMRPILAHTLADLRLSSSERRAFEVLAAMALEGSATYLINAHRDLGAMRRDDQFAAFLADPDRLVSQCEQLLRAILEGDLAGEQFEVAITPLVASGFHSAGALLLDTIWRDGGKDAVMAAVGDPRRLLSAYNASAARLRGQPARRRIDAILAARAASMGERQTGRP